MKNAKFVVTLITGLILAGAVMWLRGVFSAQNAAAAVMAVSDGFAVAGLLYLTMGSLMWVSTTGVFDIFAYALKKGAHALIPGMVDDSAANYYEFKMDKNEKRKKFTQHSALLIGAVFVVISLILSAVWYKLVG